MTRRELREHCFKLLFCASFHPVDETEEQLLQYFAGPVEEELTAEGKYEILHSPALDLVDGEYVKSKVAHIVKMIPELDKEVDKVAEGWSTKRMGKEEITILRLALYEIHYDEEIPEKVAINEAVELAKKFGGTDSASFVNGILAKLV